jgi:hypothetical protein
MSDKPTTINIDGIEYIRSDVANATDGDIKIVIIDRGFVYVGNVVLTDNFVVITNAKNIRVWGTTKGIGELVSGPTSSTKLDSVGTIKAPQSVLISLIDVEQEKWKSL